MKTPDLTPDLALASAYLDGAVTAAERAQVDGSPELLAVVASLRQVATLIATVPAASATARDGALASALTQFDALYNDATLNDATLNGNVVSLASRRRWPKTLLNAAAAVVIVGAIGIAISNGGSDNKDSADTAVDTKLAGDSTESAVNAEVPTVGDALPSSAAPIEINSPEELAALVSLEFQTADTTPAPSADTTADSTAGGGDSSTDNEAYRYESFNVDALACMTDDQMFLADIYYKGTLAIAVRDTVTGVTEAIDDSCTVLAFVNP